MSEEQSIDDRVNETEIASQKLTKKLYDLIEYLERTNVLPVDDQAFNNWEERLTGMRYRDDQRKRVNEAKKMLEREGFIVVQNENEVDAVRLGNWVNSKEEK